MRGASIPVSDIPGSDLTASALADRLTLLAGVAIVGTMFLAVAFWNGFPLMFYDTGAYLAEGLSGAFLVERSPVYSLLLFFTGGAWSLWPVVILQAAMSAYVIGELARIEVPGLSLAGLCAVGAALTALTGIGWYVGQVEPDCMTALVMLGSYLLLFRWRPLGRAGRGLMIAITGLAVASHPSHLGLIAGFVIIGACVRVFARRLPNLPPPALMPLLSALALALALTFASNYALTRNIFISRSASVFVFARLMQDGIVRRLLDDTCPRSGSHRPAPYKLCAYRHRLKTRADAWLWSPDSAFRAEGGFQHSQGEDERIISDSLRRYPLMQVKAALYDSVLQFFLFRTGDGIVSQEWILKPGLAKVSPRQLPAYLKARQQHEKFRFRTLNMIHVTVGMLSLLGSVLLLYQAGRRGRWNEAALPGLVLLGLVGNAIICGTFSNPHDRYQSRAIWVPALVLLLARARDPRALQPAADPDR